MAPGANARSPDDSTRPEPRAGRLRPKPRRPSAAARAEPRPAAHRPDRRCRASGPCRGPSRAACRWPSSWSSPWPSASSRCLTRLRPRQRPAPAGADEPRGPGQGRGGRGQGPGRATRPTTSDGSDRRLGQRRPQRQRRSPSFGSHASPTTPTTSPRRTCALRFGLGSQTSAGDRSSSRPPASTFTAPLTARRAAARPATPSATPRSSRFADPVGRQADLVPRSQPLGAVHHAGQHHRHRRRLPGLITSLGALRSGDRRLVAAGPALHHAAAPADRSRPRRWPKATWPAASRPIGPGPARPEITELSRQFNAMADQVEETMDVIRRDRDRSREFLADVSHELRTPLAALRTFNELLQEKAGDDAGGPRRIPRVERPADRTARLAGPEPARAVQARLGPDPPGPAPGRPSGDGPLGRGAGPGGGPAARRRAHHGSARCAARRPPRPAAPRPGRDQPRRQRPQVHPARRVGPGGAGAPCRRRRASRSSTRGVGIDAAELPHIFDRFYRGSRANEARGSGSGLGLAIVRSDRGDARRPDRGREPGRDGSGSTFTVTLPADPRSRAEGEAACAGDRRDSAGAERRAPRPAAAARAGRPHRAATGGFTRRASTAARPTSGLEPATSTLATRSGTDSATKR